MAAAHADDCPIVFQSPCEAHFPTIMTQTMVITNKRQSIHSPFSIIQATDEVTKSNKLFLDTVIATADRLLSLLSYLANS